MHGYQLDHRMYRFDLKFPDTLSHLRHKSYIIRRTALDSLYARIVVSKKYGKVRHRLVRLTDTPHFAYLRGKVDRYREYLGMFGLSVGYGAEHSIANFDTLRSTTAGYLEGDHASEYIVCEQVKTLLNVRNVILDGVHRACLLLHEGIRDIPVAFLFDNLPNCMSQFTQYLEDYRDDFLEWYTPIEVGGRIIHERTYPDFQERPAAKGTFAAPWGFERIPVLGRIMGGVRRLEGYVNESLSTLFGEKQAGRALAPCRQG